MNEFSSNPRKTDPYLLELSFSDAISEHDDSGRASRLLSIVLLILLGHESVILDQSFLDLYVQMASNNRFATMLLHTDRRRVAHERIIHVSDDLKMSDDQF